VIGDFIARKAGNIGVILPNLAPMAAQAVRLEGAAMTDKKTAAARRESDAWRARVLFLCFHSLRDVTRHTKVPVSSVARWVTDDRLEAVRTRHELRIPALIALYKASPKGFARFIETQGPC
jgi:hypothetical protein